MVLKRGDVVKFRETVQGRHIRVDRGVYGEVINGKDAIFDGYAKIIGLSVPVPFREEEVSVIPDGTYD